METLIAKLKTEFPDITFQSGESFYWSPQNKSVIYNSKTRRKNAHWPLLHEVAHAKLGHLTYQSDIELLYMEVAAWHSAVKIGKKYGVAISDDYIQNCLDSYRNWVHLRSTCPNCETHSLQSNSTHYTCFNCHTTWKVSIARFCRPYRKIELKKETSPTVSPQVMFI